MTGRFDRRRFPSPAFHRSVNSFGVVLPGFAIGGVPPVGHEQPPVVFIDEDLLAFAEVWAAAGTPNAVSRLDHGDLARLSGGRVARVKT